MARHSNSISSFNRVSETRELTKEEKSLKQAQQDYVIFRFAQSIEKIAGKLGKRQRSRKNGNNETQVTAEDTNPQDSSQMQDGI